MVQLKKLLKKDLLKSSGQKRIFKKRRKLKKQIIYDKIFPHPANSYLSNQTHMLNLNSQYHKNTIQEIWEIKLISVGYKRAINFLKKSSQKQEKLSQNSLKDHPSIKNLNNKL